MSPASGSSRKGSSLGRCGRVDREAHQVVAEAGQPDHARRLAQDRPPPRGAAARPRAREDRQRLRRLDRADGASSAPTGSATAAASARTSRSTSASSSGSAARSTPSTRRPGDRHSRRPRRRGATVPVPPGRAVVGGHDAALLRAAQPGPRLALGREPAAHRRRTSKPPVRSLPTAHARARARPDRPAQDRHRGRRAPASSRRCSRPASGRPSLCIEIDQPVRPWTFWRTVRRIRSAGYTLVAVDHWNLTFSSGADAVAERWRARADSMTAAPAAVLAARRRSGHRAQRRAVHQAHPALALPIRPRDHRRRRRGTGGAATSRRRTAIRATGRSRRCGSSRRTRTRTARSRSSLPRTTAIPTGSGPARRMSRAAPTRHRATGDYLWQVDIDEFYLAEDMERVSAMLPPTRRIDAMTFRQITFWGGLDYVGDGWYLRRGAADYHRLFRWGPGFSYATHRPPTVLDETGRDLRTGRWLDADRDRGDGHPPLPLLAAAAEAGHREVRATTRMPTGRGAPAPIEWAQRGLAVDSTGRSASTTCMPIRAGWSATAVRIRTRRAGWWPSSGPGEAPIAAASDRRHRTPPRRAGGTGPAVRSSSRLDPWDLRVRWLGRRAGPARARERLAGSSRRCARAGRRSGRRRCRDRGCAERLTVVQVTKYAQGGRRRTHRLVAP